MAGAQWARIEPLLPDRALKRGGRRRGHRGVIDDRLRMWAVDGTWERVFTTPVARTALICLAGLNVAGIFLWSAR
ncbi:hypothetical protein [Streptomyces bauhiniae]